jgi:hypothetical protein
VIFQRGIALPGPKDIRYAQNVYDIKKKKKETNYPQNNLYVKFKNTALKVKMSIM